MTNKTLDRMKLDELIFNYDEVDISELNPQEVNEAIEFYENAGQLYSAGLIAEKAGKEKARYLFRLAIEDCENRGDFYGGFAIASRTGFKERSHDLYKRYAFKINTKGMVLR